MDEKKVYRITFSKSLSEKLAYQTGKQSKKVSLILGDKVENIESEQHQLFAICKTKSKWPLRVTMFKDLAKMWEMKGVRDIYQCSLKVIN